MSRRAPPSLFADLCVSSSYVTRSRLGSVPTPWHTSLMKSAVMSLISLWRIEGKPPREQLRACSMVNCLSQTHREGNCCGRHPYRRHSASRKAPLCRANPCSSIGRVESQVEAPFSDDTSIALRKLGGRFLVISLASACSCCLRVVREWFLACLLYTSPSPRDATLSRMPSSA